MEHMILQGLTLVDLKKAISEAVDESLVKRNSHPTESVKTFLTSREVGRILQVSQVTLSEWRKSGLLPAYRIGTRIRYKNDDVQKALRQSGSLKYQRKSNFP